jgi:hypothetical protein
MRSSLQSAVELEDQRHHRVVHRRHGRYVRVPGSSTDCVYALGPVVIGGPTSDGTPAVGA